jgi:hypothetical protein
VQLGGFAITGTTNGLSQMGKSPKHIDANSESLKHMRILKLYINERILPPQNDRLNKLLVNLVELSLNEMIFKLHLVHDCHNYSLM